jgi:hypothetical protein
MQNPMTEQGLPAPPPGRQKRRVVGLEADLVPKYNYLNDI